MSSVIPGVQPLTWVRYATFDIDTVYKDGVGTIIPTTGFKGIFEVRQDFDSDVTIYKSTSESGSIWTFGGVTGTIKMVLPPTETLKVLAGLYYYVLAIKNGTRVDVLMEGELTVKSTAFRSQFDW